MLEQQECWNGDGEDHGEQVLYNQREQVCLKTGISAGSSQVLLTRVCDVDLCQADPSPSPDNTGCAAFSGQAAQLSAEAGEANPT